MNIYKLDYDRRNKPDLLEVVFPLSKSLVLCWGCFRTLTDSDCVSYISGFGYGVCRSCYDAGFRIDFNPHAAHHCNNLFCSCNRDFFDRIPSEFLSDQEVLYE